MKVENVSSDRMVLRWPRRSRGSQTCDLRGFEYNIIEYYAENGNFCLAPWHAWQRFDFAPYEKRGIENTLLSVACYNFCKGKNYL